MEDLSSLDSVVNLSRYPVHDPTTEGFLCLVEESRKIFLKDGIVTLPGFFTEDAVVTSVQEVEGAKAAAWFTDASHNVFLDSGDPALPGEHIRNRELPTTVASLAYDLLSSQGPLLTLYHSDTFLFFLSSVLGLTSFHRLADPLAAATINIFKPGAGHNWHFDECPFSVTLMLQKPEAGGEFRLTKKIRERGAEDDFLYETIEAVVEGTDDIVANLQFEPGTLSIFSGSACLHEVTKVQGERDRLTAVFCFTTQPGVKNSPKVQEMFWGRVVN